MTHPGTDPVNIASPTDAELDDAARRFLVAEGARESYLDAHPFDPYGPPEPDVRERLWELDGEYIEAIRELRGGMSARGFRWVATAGFLLVAHESSSRHVLVIPLDDGITFSAA